MTSSLFTDDDLTQMLRTRADRVDAHGIEEAIAVAILRERGLRTASRRRRWPTGGVLLVAAALLTVAAFAGSLATGSARRPPERPSGATSVNPVVAHITLTGPRHR